MPTLIKLLLLLVAVATVALIVILPEIHNGAVADPHLHDCHEFMGVPCGQAQARQPEPSPLQRAAGGVRSGEVGIESALITALVLFFIGLLCAYAIRRPGGRQ